MIFQQDYDSDTYYTPRSTPTSEFHSPDLTGESYNKDHAKRHLPKWKSTSTRSKPIAQNQTIFGKIREKLQSKYTRGWLVVMAGFILHVPMMGFVMSFGELLNPMLRRYHSNTSTLSKSNMHFI